MDYLTKLESCPEDCYIDPFKEKIDRTKELFKIYEEYVNKPIVKCCVIGNLSSGKSTLINALLNMDILYEGITEGTSCAAKCQATSNNKKFFKMYEGNICLDEEFPIEKIKDINKTNRNHAQFSMGTSNYLDIYLKIPDSSILQKFLMIDCPGFHETCDINTISNYCEYADIIVFCFTAKAGVTDLDIENIKKIKRNIGNFQRDFINRLGNPQTINSRRDGNDGKFLINFIINRCDEDDSINRNAIVNQLTPHLTESNTIFFISAKEEKKPGAVNNNNNNERHLEFEQFKKCLLRQKSIAANTYRKVYLNLIRSVNESLSCYKFKKYNYEQHQLNDIQFMELQDNIFRLINNNSKSYKKSEINRALYDYSTQINKDISDFLMKQFINDYKLTEIITDANYFFKNIIRDDDIEKPDFYFFNWGDQKEKMQTSFLNFFFKNSKKIRNDIKVHYDTKVKSLLDEPQKYENELQNIIRSINKLVMVVN